MRTIWQKAKSDAKTEKAQKKVKEILPERKSLAEQQSQSYDELTAALEDELGVEDGFFDEVDRPTDDK